jgi:hypothetical protein
MLIRNCWKKWGVVNKAESQMNITANGGVVSAIIPARVV